jgi:dihydroorotate dehydrogenase (NAD+) catalytic subunit
MTDQPYYDPTKTYEENYDKGPFGAFADRKVFLNSGEPKQQYFSDFLFLPCGIPAGPIINSNFAKAAFEKGFDIVVYKTVRSDFFPCHPFPNILSVHVDNLTLTRLKEPILADTNYTQPLSITNSFGVPSKPHAVWLEDVKRAVSYAGQGQVLVLSFMGTVKQNQTQQEFVDDFAKTAAYALETKAHILEIDLSCPNFGNEGLVCYDFQTTEAICKAIRKVIGKVPLILKVGYYEKDEELQNIAAIANEHAQGIAGINTLAGKVVDAKGQQALSGEMRLTSGICGHAIKWAGIDFVRRLKKIKEKNKYTFAIEGIGGVETPDDYYDYIEAGADSVMSATGSMWNPFLAQEIKSAKASGK